jgi:hypothetical protein
MRALSQLRAEARRSARLKSDHEYAERHKRQAIEAARRRRARAVAEGADWTAEIRYGGKAIRLRASREKFIVRPGSICQRGHVWPGASGSLRRHEGPCAVCTSTRGDLWWLLFADWGASDFESSQKLGKLCRHGHRWSGMPVSLRRSADSKCIECQRLRHAGNRGEWDRRYKESGGRARAEARRQERIKSDPEYRARRLAIGQRKRDGFRLHGLTSRGRPPAEKPCPEQTRLSAWLRAPVISPCVWLLVSQHSHQHWKDHPDDRGVIMNPWNAQRAQYRWMVDEEFRIYHREKSKRRKAQDREVWLQRVSAKDIRALRARFNGCCAYCGVKCDTEIDHFQPIAKGGTHVLSNLLPACHYCNAKKRDHDPEGWCRRQPWFTEKKWRQLLGAMGKKPATASQLALI